MQGLLSTMPTLSSFLSICISYFVIVGLKISFNSCKYLEMVGNDCKLLEMVQRLKPKKMVGYGGKLLEMTRSDWE